MLQPIWFEQSTELRRSAAFYLQIRWCQLAFQAIDAFAASHTRKRLLVRLWAWLRWLPSTILLRRRTPLRDQRLEQTRTHLYIIRSAMTAIQEGDLRTVIEALRWDVALLRQHVEDARSYGNEAVLEFFESTLRDAQDILTRLEHNYPEEAT